VAARDHNGERQPRLGYIAAILISALGHIAIFALVFFIAPMYLKAPEAAPPAYTVKIVDDIPAGDLGTHLPRINRNRKEAKVESKPEEPKVKVEEPKPPELTPEEQKLAAVESQLARLEDDEPLVDHPPRFVDPERGTEQRPKAPRDAGSWNGSRP